MAHEPSPWVDHLWNRYLDIEPSWEPEDTSVRTEAAAHLVSSLDASGAPQWLGDAEARRQWFSTMTVEQFENLLVNVNGVARNVGAAQRQFTAQKVTVGGWAAPDPEDKPAILERTLAVAQEIARDPAVPADEALANAAVVLGGGLTYVHPFLNGNGRTSRIISFLVADGYDGGASGKAAVAALVASDARTRWGTNPKHIDDSLYAALDAGIAGERRPPLDRMPVGQTARSWFEGMPRPPANSAEEALLGQAMYALLSSPTANLALRDTLANNGLIDESLFTYSSRHPRTGEDLSETRTFLDVGGGMQRLSSRPDAMRLMGELVERERQYRVSAIAVYLDTMGDMFLGREVNLPTVAERATTYVDGFRASRVALRTTSVPSVTMGSAAEFSDVALAAAPPEPTNAARHRPNWWPLTAKWSPESATEPAAEVLPIDPAPWEPYRYFSRTGAPTPTLPVHQRVMNLLRRIAHGGATEVSSAADVVTDPVAPHIAGYLRGTAPRDAGAEPTRPGAQTPPTRQAQQRSPMGFGE